MDSMTESTQQVSGAMGTLEIANPWPKLMDRYRSLEALYQAAEFQPILEYLNFRRVVMMQEILYNSKLTPTQQDNNRGALHELDQLLLLPQTAKRQQQIVEKGGLRAVDTKDKMN